MKYLLMALAFLISVFIARMIIPRILLISYRKKLFDSQEERKVHKGAIPRLGGVSFFPTILFSCCGVLAFSNLLSPRFTTTASCRRCCCLSADWFCFT